MKILLYQIDSEAINLGLKPIFINKRGWKNE
jgi:hypothetical protein